MKFSFFFYVSNQKLYQKNINASIFTAVVVASDNESRILFGGTLWRSFLDCLNTFFKGQNELVRTIA